MEQDTTTQATPQPETRRRLTRSRSDRMVAGVCGGIADYFGIDALLIRIGFVVATVFGGTGLLAYGIAWVVVPEKGRRRAIGHKLLRTSANPSALALVLLVVGGLILFHEISHTNTMTTAVALLAAGVALLLWTPSKGQGGAGGDVPPPPPPSAPPPPPPPGAPPAQESTPEGPPPAAPRPRSPLGRFTLSAILLMAGAVGIADAAGALDASADGVMAGALVMTGLALVVGAWWGRSRGLVALGIVLTLSLGTTDWLDLDFSDGWGDRRIAPDVEGELDREYRLSGGELRLDLSDYPFEDGVTEVSVVVAMGHINVTLPTDVHAVIEARSKMGHIDLYGDDEGGVNVERRAVQDRPGAPELHLDLKATLGQIEVNAAP